MTSCRALLCLLSLILCCYDAEGVPVSKGIEDIHIVTTYLPSYATVLISLGALLLLAYFILGCVCCPNKSIKALSYQNGFPVSRLNENNFENPTEITIFPPHSTVIDLQPVSPSFPGFDDKVTFEPLPDILPKKFTTGQSAACSSRPAHFNALLKSKVSLHDWFDDPNSNFPREQLQYLQEIGVGWFGRVIEGEASLICDNEEKTAVIVKILREEASPSEHLHFLHEVRSYRDLKHTNVIKLLGRCLESDPFLLIMEHSISDLKTYLIKQEKREVFLQDGLMLQMISNIASGLRYMHDKGFCHMDLAAHNCFICSDNSVKIGDYGVSFDRWKGDYYCLGDIALPLRWYSPEILRCSESTIETKEITKEANVWAFGVVLWEIVELGKLPYEELSDEEVLQKVLIERSIHLSPPAVEIICKDEIVLVMKECWKPKKYRPVMEKIESFISQLYTDRLTIKNKELSFEERWNSIQPRITEISSYTGTESSSLKFENDFSTRSDLQNYSSDNEILSSFEMSFDILPKNGFNAQLSPSLNVLNGSIDELTENDAYLNSISLSCGKYDADTLSNISDKDNFQMEEDKDNVHSNNVISEQISAAIRDLDLVLASQPDSSRNSTLQKSKSVLQDSEIPLKNREISTHGILKESHHLSKSSDMSNISESSLSKSSNFSDHVEHLSKDKSNELSVNSDLNGNCDFYDTDINKKYDEVVVAASDMTSEPDRYESESGINYDVDINGLVSGVDKTCNTGTEYEEINAEDNFSGSSQRLSLVPEIIIHESPSINSHECLEDNFESENNHNHPENKNLSKTFRFVFRDTSELDAAEINQQDFRKELAYDLTESLKKSDRSKPLTSTPVKSNRDSYSQSSNFPNSDVTENNSNNDVFCESIIPLTSEKNYHNDFSNSEINFNSSDIKAVSSPEHLNFISDLDISNKSSDLQNVDSDQETANSTDLEHFTTAQSSLCLSKSDNIVKSKVSENDCNEKTYLEQTKDVTLHFNDTCGLNEKTSDFETEKSNNSNTYYISADSTVLKEDYSDMFSEVISPPNGYDSSSKGINYSIINKDISNNYLEDSKASETVSPPQAFQDNGLSVLNDSCSGSKTSIDQEFSTSAECGSSENLDQYLEDDHITQANISTAKLLETSFPDVESKSFIYETSADFSGNMRPRKNNSSLALSEFDKRNSKLYESDYAVDGHQNYNLYKSMKPPIQSYDQMIVEDLDTGEQTVINESYSVCDDFENSGESDEILKINTETDEAIIVDSSEALIGFVPSRSIELLQEFEVIPPMNPSYALDEEKESSDSMNIDAYNSASPSPAAMKHNSSPYESPEPAYLQPYRNFCLQNEVIEEEITDEIVSPSSYHSSSSYCSNEIFMDEEKMSQSSESAHHGEMYETSVMPSVDHLYVASDDGSKTDVSSSECSPVKRNEIVNAKYRTDAENNHISQDQEDVMHSYQPSHSVRWLSDETLDVDGDDQSPIIIEGREILAGDIIQTCELTAEDIACALSQLEAKSHLHGLTPNHLNVSPSPSPFSSVESSPCRDAVYTPDFESDSEETGSGTSCSSTSGSFECIHNKFKNAVDISKVVDESDKSASSRQQSPMKIFSKTWDCHATPTRGVLVTPEKKFNSMRKSVSFHEEDPQVVFEYPPASDSSEDGYPSDDHEEFCHNIDYLKYADWDLQVADVDDIEAEEIVEIEELDSEPYVRRPAYSSSSVGPLNRPMLYTLTSGFSDEDFDLSDTVSPFPFNAPSNSPEEEKVSTLSGSQICELIQSQLSNLSDRENLTQVKQNTAHSQLNSFNSVKEGSSVPMTSVQKSVVSSVDVDDIVIDELLPECQNSENVTVHKGSHSDVNDSNLSDDDDDDDDDEVIVEELELSDGDSDSESFEFNKENRPIVLETDSAFCYDMEFFNEIPNDELALGGKTPQLHKSENINTNASCSHPSLVQENTLSGNLLDLSKDIIEECKNKFHCENADLSVCNNALNSRKTECLNDLNGDDHKEETTQECSNDSKVVVSDKKNISIHMPTKENAVVGFAEDSNKKANFTETEDTISNNNTKSGDSGFIDIQFSAPKTPVHAVSFESEYEELNSIDSFNGDSPTSADFAENCRKEILENSIATSEMPTESNLITSKESIEENHHSDPRSFKHESTNSTPETVNIPSNPICSKEAISHTENREIKAENSDILFNKPDSINALYRPDVVLTNLVSNEIEDGIKNLVNDYSALTDDYKTSFLEEENVAQWVIEPKCSSSSGFTDLSEVFCSSVTKDETNDELSLKDNVLKTCEDKSDSEVLVDITSDFDAKETVTVHDSKCVDKHHNSEPLLHVPKIIVTPASESEADDELEEYLRGQLEHYHSEVSPQEDFSVTSEFSSRPFDDVFGSYISGDSSEYTEAFNFEFENGNFFEDYVDDYPHDLQTDVHDRLCPDNGRQKRSSSLPLMTENLSDDDSLTMKSDSSLIYDSSKGVTRL